MAATELYSHKGDTGLGKAAFDDFENRNEAQSNAAVVAALHKRLAAQFSKNSGCTAAMVGKSDDPAARLRWPGGSGIRQFLSWDAHLTPREIGGDNISRIDFVWAAGSAIEHPQRVDPSHVAAWHAKRPEAVVTHYLISNRDPNQTLMQGCDGPTADRCPGLKWYKQHRADFVLYQCDRTTPAWFRWGKSTFGPLIPLDFSNPKVSARSPSSALSCL